MAGGSQKEIKTRIRSMRSTRQITKAMETVAASKLRKAQYRVAASRPYFEILQDTVHTIVEANRDFSSPYLKKTGGSKCLYIVIGGDRGLAGGYNSNVFKFALAQMEGKTATVLPLGKRTLEFFKARQLPMLRAYGDCVEALSVNDCFTVAKDLSHRFLTGEFDAIDLVYTNFVSVLTQAPVCLRLLPLLHRETKDSGTVRCDTLYEPDSTQVFARIVPEYLGGVLYGALCESKASEHAARRAAMDSASRNADEMIADLSLKYNRVRQAAITQEITEIVAGN